MQQMWVAVRNARQAGGVPLFRYTTWVQTRVLLREWKYSVMDGSVDSERVWCAPSRMRVVVRSMIERARMHETHCTHAHASVRADRAEAVSARAAAYAPARAHTQLHTHLHTQHAPTHSTHLHTSTHQHTAQQVHTHLQTPAHTCTHSTRKHAPEDSTHHLSTQQARWYQHTACGRGLCRAVQHACKHAHNTDMQYGRAHLHTHGLDRPRTTRRRCCTRRSAVSTREMWPTALQGLGKST